MQYMSDEETEQALRNSHYYDPICTPQRVVLKCHRHLRETPSCLLALSPHPQSSKTSRARSKRKLPRGRQRCRDNRLNAVHVWHSICSTRVSQANQYTPAPVRTPRQKEKKQKPVANMHVPYRARGKSKQPIYQPSSSPTSETPPPENPTSRLLRLARSPAS